MAYEVLFAQKSGNVDPQYAVAQALMAAFEMGQRGFYPPRPKHLEARRHEEPSPDPEMDTVYQEIRMLSWSPLQGTPRPEGHVKWSMKRHFEKRAAEAAPPPGRVIVRQRPTPATPTVTVIRRSR